MINFENNKSSDDYMSEYEVKMRLNGSYHEMQHPYMALILLEMRQIKKQLNIESSTTKVYKPVNGILVNEVPVTSHQQVREFIDSDIKITEQTIREKNKIPMFKDGIPVSCVRKSYVDDFEECYDVHLGIITIQYLFNI